MTVEDYIRKKNILIHNIIGITLVPEDQIQEVTQYPLDFAATESCPYCMVFWDDDCTGCPMLEAGNPCVNIHYRGTTEYKEMQGDVDKSSYVNVQNTLREIHNIGISEVPGLQELIIKYNEELCNGT